MKNSKVILLSFMSVNLFGQTLKGTQTGKVDSVFPKIFNTKIKSIQFKDFQVKDFENLKNSIDRIDKSDIPFSSEQVLIEDELIKLFDPESFKCDCDEKLVKNIKKLVASKKTKDQPEKLGFIPKIVSDRITNVPAIKISGFGSKILTNSFTYTYKLNDKLVSESGSVMDAPTAKSFNIEDYFEYNAANFLYNLDCSGYLSAVLNANVGVSGNAIETSAKAALKNTNSLIIISGIVYSPLYQSYRGFGVFKDKNKKILEIRKEVLENILISIPNYAQSDDTKIIIPTDYKIVITSNKGDSSFNGDGSLSGRTGISFGFGSISGQGEATGKIERKSNFSDFDCYVIKLNNLNQPDSITRKDLKNKVEEINSLLKKL